MTGIVVLGAPGAKRQGLTCLTKGTKRIREDAEEEAEEHDQGMPELV